MNSILQKYQINLVILIILAGVVIVHLISGEPLCVGNSRACLENENCCVGCCLKNKCVANSEACKENDPCLAHECPPNSECHLQQVFCFRAPCPPIPQCRPSPV